MSKAKKQAQLGNDDESTANLQQAIAEGNPVVTIIGTGNPDGHLVKGEKRDVLKSVADILIKNGEAILDEE